MLMDREGDIGKNDQSRHTGTYPFLIIYVLHSLSKQPYHAFKCINMSRTLFTDIQLHSAAEGRATNPKPKTE